MNKTILILFALIVSIQLHAQVKRIYGYKQEMVGGNIKAADDIENKSGNEKSSSSATIRYFIFAEIDKGKAIIPLQLWLNKKSYSFTIDTVKTFPLIHISSDGGERILRDTLIKSTTGYIIQLKNPVQLKQQTIEKNIKKNILVNSIVFIYRYNKKTYRIFLKKLKKLTPIFVP